MTERDGLSWWLVEKTFLKDSDKCVMAPVIPPHLSEGVCLYVKAVESIWSRSRNTGSMLVFLCTIVCMQL